MEVRLFRGYILNLFKLVACYNLGAQLLEIRDRFEEKWVDLHCRLRGTTRKLP